jgi:hypothetical protein
MDKKHPYPWMRGINIFLCYCVMVGFAFNGNRTPKYWDLVVVMAIVFYLTQRQTWRRWRRRHLGDRNVLDRTRPSDN